MRKVSQDRNYNPTSVHASPRRKVSKDQTTEDTNSKQVYVHVRKKYVRTCKKNCRFNTGIITVTPIKRKRKIKVEKVVEEVMSAFGKRREKQRRHTGSGRKRDRGEKEVGQGT